MAQNYQLSDPKNRGPCVFNIDFSDEFDGAALNKTR